VDAPQRLQRWACCADEPARAHGPAHADCMSGAQSLFLLASSLEPPFRFTARIGLLEAGGNIDHDYAGRGLARLYETARRQFAARQTSATIIQFPRSSAGPQ
jgi:hypothetical protein